MDRCLFICSYVLTYLVVLCFQYMVLLKEDLCMCDNAAFLAVELVLDGSCKFLFVFNNVLVTQSTPRSYLLVLYLILLKVHSWVFPWSNPLVRRNVHHDSWKEDRPQGEARIHCLHHRCKFVQILYDVFCVCSWIALGI